MNEILKCDHSMKTTEQYFPVVLFIMLYKLDLTFSVSILAAVCRVGVNASIWAIINLVSH